MVSVRGKAVGEQVCCEEEPDVENSRRPLKG